MKRPISLKSNKEVGRKSDKSLHSNTLKAKLDRTTRVAQQLSTVICNARPRIQENVTLSIQQRMSFGMPSVDVVTLNNVRELQSLSWVTIYVKGSTFQQSCYLILDAKTVFFLADCLFGGHACPYTKIEGKDFSPTEIQLAHEFSQIISSSIGDSIVGSLAESMATSGCNDDLHFHSWKPTATMLRIQAKIEFEKVGGVLTFILPVESDLGMPITTESTKPECAADLSESPIDDVVAALRSKFAGICPEAFALVLINEHPQTIAALLSLTDGETATRTLMLLPISLHPEVLLRILNLSAIPSVGLNVLNWFGERYSVRLASRWTKIGGVEPFRQIIENWPSEHRKELLNELEVRKIVTAEDLSIIFPKPRAVG